MIKLENVEKIYASAGGDVHALKPSHLTISKGENVVIVGKSGSGKSTLLNIISGIDRPSQGHVEVNGQNLVSLNENELALWRGRNVGIVFQFYQLLPTISTLDNVLFAMSLVNKIPSNDRRDHAMQYLEEVGLKDKAGKFPNELSGGERQRVAIARSLANKPAIIIADEPTGNLDSKTGDQIEELFQKLNKNGTTLLTVTHASIEGKPYDRVLQIEDGVLAETTQNQH